MTVAVILVASVDTCLEGELLDAGAEYSHLHGLPKALLPITGGKRVLDYWWGAIEGQRQISDVYLVTNAKQFKHFERWATSRGIPASKVINDGSTMRCTSLGAARDLLLALTRAGSFGDKGLDQDVMVIAGDSLFHRDFDLHSVVTERHVEAGQSLAVTYRLGADEDASTRGIAEVDASTRQVLRFVEKPSPGATASRDACPLFYILKPDLVALLPAFVEEHDRDAKPSLGGFMAWAINDKGSKVYSMRMPGVFRLIGDAGLQEYLDLVEHFERIDAPSWSTAGGGKHTVKAHARVGLFGNPSDGYHGATIALTIANFWASATIAPSERLCLVPHPLFDPCDFGSLADLHFISRREGYQGGMRLLQAACKRFFEYCAAHGVALPKRNFTLSYETNVPRQVGLAGSSAIVTAAIKAMIAFFSLDESHVPAPVLPNLVLSIEAELGINAGLQDRVVQAYEGLVAMDFDKAHFDAHGFGVYERLPPHQLHAAPPRVDIDRRDVKQRWHAGDPVAVAGMEKIADVAKRAKVAIALGDATECKKLMAENFSLRRALFGDAVLGRTNLQLIDIAAKHGGVAKFPGSGGAVVGTCDEGQLDAIRKAYEAESFVFVVLKPHFPAASPGAALVEAAN
ncbi:glucuronokinase [Aureococcus anophagefferens]|uniref:Glucuronokinase n=1 Tax=Aureococcus anophagefferens TaxID=44056 RepID=A0ABR1G7S1_AURAN